MEYPWNVCRKMTKVTLKMKIAIATHTTCEKCVLLIFVKGTLSSMFKRFNFHKIFPYNAQYKLGLLLKRISRNKNILSHFIVIIHAFVNFDARALLTRRNILTCWVMMLQVRDYANFLGLHLEYWFLSKSFEWFPISILTNFIHETNILSRYIRIRKSHRHTLKEKRV